MIEAFWIPLLPPYLIGLALSWAIEAMLTPRPVAPWRRPAAANAVHVGVWTLAFALELALFRRPYFGVANVLAIQLLIVLVNNAKYRALREPFVYPDFEYFMDAIKHPRLYLPFFGLARALAAGGGYGAALWAGLVLEDSVTAGAGIWLVSFAELPQEHMLDPSAPVVPFFACSLSLAAIGLAVALNAGRRNFVNFDAVGDLGRLGLAAALWAYGRAERQPISDMRINAPFALVKPPDTLPDPLPDLVVVQSESFFDARRAFPGLLREDILANFDLLKIEAVAHGQLEVPAWGANTVRTEFAFLSGVDSSQLGVHRYNPYRRLTTQAFPSIATYLRSVGYYTVCVHPFDGTFYQRHLVYPLLGFQEFVDIAAFKDAKCEGRYVGDKAVAEQVIAMLGSKARGPLYIHVITMENHGPLHLDEIGKCELGRFLCEEISDGCKDLVAYARHLQNADAMFGILREAMLSGLRPAALCVFGDHVPIMPAVYQKLGQPDGATNYLIWSSEVSAGGVERPLPVAHLAQLFLSSCKL